MHKVPPGHASHPISRVGSSDNMGSQLSEIEEEEIERLMARGYTREQALEVYSEAMGRQLRNTSVEENSSSSNRVCLYFLQLTMY